MPGKHLMPSQILIKGSTTHNGRGGPIGLTDLLDKAYCGGVGADRITVTDDNAPACIRVGLNVGAACREVALRDNRYRCRGWHSVLRTT